MRAGLIALGLVIMAAVAWQTVMVTLSWQTINDANRPQRFQIALASDPVRAAWFSPGSAEKGQDQLVRGVLDKWPGSSVVAYRIDTQTGAVSFCYVDDRPECIPAIEIEK